MNSSNTSYIFSASGKTITLLEETVIDISSIRLITNATRNITYYEIGDVSKTITVSGNVITLNANISTSGHADSDKLIVVQDRANFGSIGNALGLFRDGFVLATPDTSIWSQTWTNQGTGLVNKGGDSSGATYMRISMCPFASGSEYLLESKATFSLPMRFSTALSLSQRILGQEFEISLVGTDPITGLVETGSAFPDVAISGSILTNGTVATINTTVPHGFRGGDRVIVKNFAEKRINVGPVIGTNVPVIVTPVTSTQFTVPCTLAANTYYPTGSSYVEFADPTRMSKNSFGILIDNTVATNASVFTRRNGSSIRITPNTTIATTAATQTNTSPYTDAWNASMNTELIGSIQEVFMISRTSDAISAASGQLRYSQTLPDEDKRYRIRVRAKNHSNISRPVGRITNAIKSVSAVGTITTDVPHGLTVGDYVQIYGIADTVNYANVTTAVPVLTSDGNTGFTVAMSAGTAAASSGGYVSLNNGTVTQPGAINLTIVSIQRTSNVLTVVMSGAVGTTLVAGEYCHLYGMMGGAATYEGAYKVLRLTGNNYELESVGSNFGLITTGGAVLKRTDFRVHFIMEIEHTRHIVELINQHGSNDAARAIPVQVSNTPAITVSSGTVTTVTNLSNGQGAHAATIAGNPLRIGARAMTTAAAAATGQATDVMATLYGAMLQKPYSIPELDFVVTAPKGGLLNTTTALDIKEAPGAGLRNYITSLDLFAEALTSATELEIREPDVTCSSVTTNTITSGTHGFVIGDSVVFTSVASWTGISINVTYYVLTVASGTTFTLSATRGGGTLTVTTGAGTPVLHKVLWDTKIPTTGRPQTNILFTNPLRGSVAIKTQIQTSTASGAGAVYLNAQGYVAP